MKLHFGLPSVFVAAIGGAIAMHFWSAIEEKQLHKRANFDTHEMAYGKVAEGILNVCEHIWRTEPIFQIAERIEARWKAEAEKLESNADVRRVGPRLIIKTAMKEIVLDDSGYFCPSTEGSSFEYVEFLSAAGFHFVRNHQFEYGIGFLISAKTGRRHNVAWEMFESQTGKRLAGFTEPGLMDGIPSIFRVTGDDLVEEFPGSLAYDVSDRVEIGGIIGWIDDERLLITVPQREGQHVLVLHNGKWQLED